MEYLSPLVEGCGLCGAELLANRGLDLLDLDRWELSEEGSPELVTERGLDGEKSRAVADDEAAEGHEVAWRDAVGLRVPDVVEVTQVAAATSSQDPEVGLAAVAALRGLVEVLEALQVENAQAKGWSWQQIAARLGVTKQAVHHKYAGRRFGFRR